MKVFEVPGSKLFRIYFQTFWFGFSELSGSISFNFLSRFFLNFLVRKFFALFQKNFLILCRKYLEPSCDGRLLFRFFCKAFEAKVFSNFLVRKVFAPESSENFRRKFKKLTQRVRKQIRVRKFEKNRPRNFKKLSTQKLT